MNARCKVRTIEAKHIEEVEIANEKNWDWRAKKHRSGILSLIFPS
jgi:hypothetical protein